jgi:uncharacterized protein (TIGR02266 family)
MKQSQQSATHAENRNSSGPSQRKESSAPEGVRREHDRYAVDLEVNVQSEHNLYAGLAENLSAGGLFIATHELQKVGSKIELTLRMPDSEQSYNITGEVRWLRLYNEQSDTSPGLGVRFLDLPPGASAAIERFLAQRDPLFFDDD